MSKSWTENINWHQVNQTLESLPKSQKRAYVEQVGMTVGKSYRSVYREIERRYGKRKQIERAPRVAKPDLVRKAAEIQETYRTVTLKGCNRTLSTEATIEIMREEGVEGAELLRPSTLNTALRREGYRNVDPKVRVEAAYACQQFQIDFSRSKHFQIWKPDPDHYGDWLLKVSAKELHYKDGEVKLRTWVVQLKDEYSRLRLIQYYPATGEGHLIGIEFLNWCFNRPEDEHLMRHLPERMKSDQGAFLKSQEGRSALEALHVERKLAEAGNSDSQGKVESGFRTLWQCFEAVQATKVIRAIGSGAVVRLSELNRLVHEYTISEHAWEHPVRRGQQRGPLYQQSILRHRPKEVDVDLRELALRTWERLVDATRMVTVNNVAFEAPAYAAGKWIRVHRNVAGDFVGELIDGYRDKPFTLRPYRFADLDDFEHRSHRTYAQEVRQDVKQELAVKKLRPAAEKVHPQSPFIEAATPAEPERLTLFEARAELGRQLRAMDLGERETAAFLNQATHRGAIYDGMTRADLDGVAARLFDFTPQKKAV